MTFWDLYGVQFLGGLAVAAVCSVLSVLVVLKRMSFIGEGIAHAAFGGVGVALLAGVALPALRPELARDGVVAVFCVLAALGIGWTARRARMAEDTSIGIWLVAAMALGVVLLDVRAQWVASLAQSGSLQGDIGYTPTFESLLFGDMLFISPGEVAAAWVLTAAVLLAMAMFYKELVFFAFDDEAARAFGVPTTAIYYGMLVALSLAVVVAMRSLGVILAAALLILPGATARLWSRRITLVLLASAFVGVGGLAAGFVLSVQLGVLSTGPVIVLTLALIFIVSAIVSAARRSLRRIGR
jgi:zinc transport system permease protein